MRHAPALILGCAVAALVAAALAFPRIEAYFVERAERGGESTLRIVAGGVNQLVQRFDPLPGLFAERASLLQALRQPRNEGVIPYVNEQLRLSAIAAGASDIFLMDTTGLTIAASNYRTETSFIGQVFDYRPYFLTAVSGRKAQYHALGTTSGERGFFFASPVLDGISIKGVIALKVTVDEIERSWSGIDRDIAVTDPNGVIFLSTRPGWRFASLTTLSDDTRDQIARTRQFPLDQVRPLPVSTDVTRGGAVVLTVTEGDGPETFVVESVPIALPGWHAVVFSPMAGVRADTSFALLVWGLIVAILALGGLLIVQRHARLSERMRIQRNERRLLEERVRERTTDLNQANQDLLREVGERIQAENRLRKTQKELVQAGKLAALGQMSAALSHEINQPLSAVLSYAENATEFLDRERIEDARENIVRISQMADRMARISGHLRNFARQPGDRLAAISVSAAIEEAIAITGPALKSRGATIRFARPEPDVRAIGGQVRLQQVLVNIFTNAMDAMASQPSPFIEVSVSQIADRVRIEVRDHGPGLPEDVIEQAFEPFFSTKAGGEGLGLGLSISYNIVEDFGGRLTVHNHPDGGAVFGVDLCRARDETKVAE